MSVYNIARVRTFTQRYYARSLAVSQFRVKSTLAAQVTDHENAVDVEPEIKPFKDIPGPSGIYQLPLVGVKFLLKPFTDFEIKRFDRVLLYLNKTYGPLVKIRLGSEWVVKVSDPSDIEKVFRNEGRHPSRGPLPIMEAYFKKKKVQKSVSVLYIEEQIYTARLNKGNKTNSTVKGQDITSETKETHSDRTQHEPPQKLEEVKSGAPEGNGEEWLAMRRPAQLSMRRPKNVGKFVPKLSEVADDFVEKFRTRGEIDNLPFPCMEYSTEGAGTLCFDTRLGCIDMTGKGQRTELMENVKLLFKVFGEQFFKFPWYNWFEDKQYKDFAKAYDHMVGVGNEHLEKAMEKLKERAEIPEEETSLMMDMISTPGMTPEMVTRNILDLFIAGVDSTAQSITFLLYQLAKHPDKQERLFKELESLVPKKGRMGNDALQKIPYLKACFKESFRTTFPVSGGTQRILDKDITLRGYNIPKGTKMMLASLVVSSDEKYFANPEKYEPERWLRDERTESVHPFALLPFGFGPRNCIGQRFAEMEVYVVIAKMIRNYKLSLPEGMTDLEYEYNTFATPVKPFKILLEAR